MSKPTSTQGLDSKLYAWVSEMSDRLGAERVSELLGATLVGAAKTKASLDKNIENLLALANIPSRGDYQRMQQRLDSLQGSVMNLTRKLNALAAGLDEAPPKPRAKTRTAAAGKAKAKTKSKSKSKSKSTPRSRRAAG